MPKRYRPKQTSPAYALFVHTPLDQILWVCEGDGANEYVIQLSVDEITFFNADPNSFEEQVVSFLYKNTSQTFSDRQIKQPIALAEDGSLWLQDRIELAYDQWAQTYDDVVNPTRDLDAVYFRRWLATTNFDTILEVGCGSGKNTRLLSEQQQVIGLDFSSKMLARCQRVAPKAELHQMDINLRWCVSQNAVDAVIFNLVLEHIQDLMHIARESARVIRPGGLLRISELHPLRQAKGKQANFHHNGRHIRIPSYSHTKNEFLSTFGSMGFECIDCNEPRDERDAESKPPRLLILLFRYMA